MSRDSETSVSAMALVTRLASRCWRGLDQRLWMVAVAPVLLVIVARWLGWEYVIGKSFNEIVAVPFIAMAAGTWLGRWLENRNRLFLVVGLQCLIFTCREIHFRGTSDGVYIATALLGLWALWLLWTHRAHVLTAEVDWRQASWLAVAILTYAVAILIQRRVFKGIPGEHSLHIDLEEVSENCAHLLMLLSGLVKGRGMPTLDSAQQSTPGRSE